MLELVEPVKPQFPENHMFKELTLQVNGVVLDEVEVIQKNIPYGTTLICFDRQTSKTVAAYLTIDVFKNRNLGTIHLAYDLDWGDGGSILIAFQDSIITFCSEPDLGKWDKPFSFQEYCEKLAEKSNHIPGHPITVETSNFGASYTNEVSVSLAFSLPTAVPLCDAVNKCSEIIRAVHLRAVESLLEDTLKHTITTCFNFQENIRVACEQYLTYFIEFLRDLGVKATHRLSHNGSETLFSVTSLEKEEALDNLRIALDAYLKLPSSPLSGCADGDIPIQRLLANISHLQGQLALAQAVIQAKDAAIHAQVLTITHQQQLLDGVLFKPIRTNEPPMSSANEREDVITGIIAVTKYCGKGFEINLPAMFRQLKRLFKKNL